MNEKINEIVLEIKRAKANNNKISYKEIITKSKQSNINYGTLYRILHRENLLRVLTY